MPVWIKTGWLGALKDTPHIETAATYSGHFPFGFHKYLQQDAKYITIIRDPLSHAISVLNFMHQRRVLMPDGFNAESKNLIDCTLLDNIQTRMLAGKDAMLQLQCDNAIYQRALDNIKRHFLFCAPQSWISELISLVLGYYKIDIPVAYVSMQKTKDKAIVPDMLISSLTSKFHQINHYDQKLYDFVFQSWNYDLAHLQNRSSIKKGKKQKILYVSPATRASHGAEIIDTDDLPEQAGFSGLDSSYIQPA